MKDATNDEPKDTMNEEQITGELPAHAAQAERMKFPFEDSKIAQYLTRQIDALKHEKSQRQIAMECGYAKPNIISMFKRGETKIPLDKVPVLAKALHVDPAHLLRLGMGQYWPDVGHAVEEVFGHIATANEEEILLKRWREKTQNRDPKSTPEIEAAVDEMLEKIRVR